MLLYQRNAAELTSPPDRALLLQRDIAKLELERPSERVLMAYRNVLRGSDQGHPRLDGEAEHMLDEAYEADLMILKPPNDNDVLSAFMRRYWIFRIQES